MVSKQPEALRQADLLEIYGSTDLARQAAEELRRLHALNVELLEALRWTLTMDATDDNHEGWDRVHAAIAKATGETK